MLASLRRIPRIEAFAALLSLSAGVALMALKFYAFYLTGSSAIFADAVESIVNVLAALFAIFALGLAHRPADDDHPYGHGKVEFISAGFEGGMIVIAAVATLYQTLHSLFTHGVEIENAGFGAALVVAAMALNGAIGLFLIRLGKSRQSLTLEADGRHLTSDAFSSAMALGAMLAVRLMHWKQADPIVAILIAAYMLRVALLLLKKSVWGLMDAQDIKDEQLLRQILDSHRGPTGKEPRICSYHKLRHRHSGRYHWVDFHLMIPSHLTIEEGHAMASSIEYEIELALKEGNATAHIEPCVDVGCVLCESERNKKQNDQHPLALPIQK